MPEVARSYWNLRVAEGTPRGLRRRRGKHGQRPLVVRRAHCTLAGRMCKEVPYEGENKGVACKGAWPCGKLRTKLEDTVVPMKSV
jgi:hypothetical protein